MFQQVLLCFTVAGGVSGLLIGLSIVPRYAGITHTANHIFLYEDMSLLGTVAGTIVTLFPVRIPLGPFFLAVCGVFFGIFLGGWILALAEIAKVFPETPETHPGTFSCDHIHCCRKNFWLSFLLCHGLDVNFTALHHLTKGFFICVILTKKNTNSMSNSLPQPTVFL